MPAFTFTPVKPVAAAESTLIAGLAPRAFEAWHPAVPPGSHYEPWIWDVLDQPGHVTLEWYIGEDQGASSAQAIAGQAAVLRRHCLIALPQAGQFPWGAAARVLLLPRGVDVAGWLARDGAGAPADGVVLGYCQVILPGETSEDDIARAYQIVLPRQAVDHLHRERFSLPEDAARRARLESTAPGQRYWGIWSSANLIGQALAAARAESGPVMPESWPAADVAYVRALHPGFISEEVENSPAPARPMA